LIIGLTIVALGTSFPELVVNVSAALKGSNGIALGNIVGSNIFNILGILGISSIILPLAVKKSTTWIEIPLAFLSALVLFVLASDNLIDNASVSTITRGDGIILLFFFAIFMGYIIQSALKNRQENEATEMPAMKMGVAIMWVVVGLGLLVVGGETIVRAAIKIAQQFGVSERVIGLTIVSIGTSLPELATSVVAAIKKNTDIAIANIVGSNIFNAFFILGTTACIMPVSISAESYFDLLLNIVASALLFIFVFTGRGRKLDRWEGVIFLVIYIIYLVWLILA
jgi:cation:H+ antiporter